MFIDENIDGSFSELVSLDVTFVENDFLGRDELHKDFHLLEIDDPNSGSQQLSKNIFDLSGSSSNNVLQDMNLCCINVEIFLFNDLKLKRCIHLK